MKPEDVQKLKAFAVKQFGKLPTVKMQSKPRQVKKPTKKPHVKIVDRDEIHRELSIARKSLEHTIWLSRDAKYRGDIKRHLFEEKNRINTEMRIEQIKNEILKQKIRKTPAASYASYTPNPGFHSGNEAIQMLPHTENEVLIKSAQAKFEHDAKNYPKTVKFRAKNPFPVYRSLDENKLHNDSGVNESG